MENVTKIDVIGKEIFCYNEITGERKIYKIDTTMEVFFNTFANGQDLLTINLINPIKRLIRFYNITDSVPAKIEEIPFANMTVLEKTIFDAFVNMIKLKL